MDRFRHPNEIAMAIRDQLKLRGLSTGTEIARASGLGQSQVHRNLFGHPKRVSRTLIALCTYAGVDAYEKAGDPSESPVLMRALAAVWDGTESHAHALANLLLAHHHARV